MGCSWWSFATKSSNYDNLVAIDNEPATLLIPEFAISWANNQSQLAIKHAGDYADFYMKNENDSFKSIILLYGFCIKIIVVIFDVG